MTINNHLNRQETGIAVVFTKAMNSEIFFKVDALMSIINSYEASLQFSYDLRSPDNRLYNRMRFLSEPVINIINVLSFIDEDEKRFIQIPVKFVKEYDASNEWKKELEKESNIDFGRDSLYVNIYNLTFDEFFDANTIYYMINEDPNNTIFYFETTVWGEIVNNFYRNGITLSGGSTNQRHIFKSLHYTKSILFLTLFGKNFSKNQTNFISFKNNNRTHYNPDFKYNSRESVIFRLFNSIFSYDEKLVKLQNFTTISNIIFHENVEFPKLISPWEVIKLWYDIITKNNDKKEIMFDILEEILNRIIDGISNDDIIEFLSKKYGIINKKIVKNFIDKNYQIFMLETLDLSRHDYFMERFYNPGPWNIRSWEKIKIKNTNFTLKR
nr:hypothetical protein [Marasmius tenuissimus]